MCEYNDYTTVKVYFITVMIQDQVQHVQSTIVTCSLYFCVLLQLQIHTGPPVPHDERCEGES